MSRCDEAIEILRATRDGDELEPRDLWLVQEAVNGHLNEAGLQAFADVLAKCRRPEGYKPRWFHDIEHLTIRHDGYVFWKGKEVEHYSGRYAYSGEGKSAASELARRARIVEARGETPTTTTLVWKWKEA